MTLETPTASATASATHPLSAITAARCTRLCLIAGIALFFTLVVFDNTTDFFSNYAFVHHVLLMDTTFPGNRAVWRALHAPWTHLAFYLSIICWEALNMLLCWTAVVALLRARHAGPAVYHRARAIAIYALTAGLLLWLVAFTVIGGEWFLMWQSKIWNGQDAAFRMFTIEALTLVLFFLPDPQN